MSLSLQYLCGFDLKKEKPFSYPHSFPTYQSDYPSDMRMIDIKAGPPLPPGRTEESIYKGLRHKEGL